MAFCSTTSSPTSRSRPTTRTACRQPRCRRQAAAQFDGADPGIRPRPPGAARVLARPAARRSSTTWRRRSSHCSTGNCRRGGAGAAAFRQPQRADRTGSRPHRASNGGGAGGARPCAAADVMTSGLAVIVREDTPAGPRWRGTADPRRKAGRATGVTRFSCFSACFPSLWRGARMNGCVQGSAPAVARSRCRYAAVSQGASPPDRAGCAAQPSCASGRAVRAGAQVARFDLG